jgi:ATP-dependent Zn protease
MMQVPNHQNQQAPHPNFWRRNRIWIILLAVPLVVPWGIFLVWQTGVSQTSEAEPVSYNLFIAQVKADNVLSVTLTDQSVLGIFKTPVASDQQSDQIGTRFSTTIPNLAAENPVPLMLSHGVKVNVQADNSNNLLLTLLLQWVPLLLPAEILYLLLVGCLALYLHGRSRPPAVRTPA